MEPPPSQKPAVITDVARRAGVSHQTVSRVMNEHPSVTPQTRERVQQAMRELQFRPNRAARNLASRRSRLLGLLSYASPHFGPSQLRLAVEHATQASGYHLCSASVSDLTAPHLQNALEQLRDQDVEGVLVIAPLSLPADELHTLLHGLPCVLLNAANSDKLPSVGIDQRLGAQLATRHLLEMGHQDIAHIGGPQHWRDAAHRLEGFLETIGKRGSSLHFADWTASGGYSAMQSLLESGFEGSAVFAANDQMALGAMRAAREMGRRIPEDLSLVGFDDIPEAAFFEPPLTTIAQDFSQLGRLGLERLLRLLQGQDSAQQTTIQPVLRQRQSVLKR